MFTRNRHKLSEVCTKCRKEEPSFKTVVSLSTISVISWLFRLYLHKGYVSDISQLKTGHLVEHLTFVFFFRQNDFKLKLMEW